MSLLEKINGTMVGSGITAGVVLLIVTVIWGGMAENSDAINDINLEIAKFNPEDTGNKLDDVIKKTERIEDKVDILTLIVCSENQAKYCK